MLCEYVISNGNNANNILSLNENMAQNILDLVMPPNK
jgi:hypothetical protein